MVKDSIKQEELVLDDSVKLNKKGEAILGVLEGPCADVINPTRNERQYDEELWNNVFKDPIVNEYFECGGILGELDHPAERTETDTSKVAICMPEKPKKGKDGKLYARFDILDTPNGRIVYTLAKYGYKLGVSSRGNGDVYEAYDGKEHVDPKSYELKAFDIVLLPAVKSARLALKESIGDKTFKQAIKESLTKATKDEKAIMIESLEKLKIDYKIQRVKKQNQEVSSNKLIESKAQSSTSAAVNNGAYVINELQRQLKRNKELTENLRQVQEQLSVCYAKETKYEELLLNNKQLNRKLVETLKIVDALKTKNESLTEQLKENKVQLEEKETLIENSTKRILKLMEARKANNESVQSLNENIDRTNIKVKKLTEELASSKEKCNQIFEQFEDLKKNSAIKDKNYLDKITKAKSLVEKYKTTTQNVLNKYISFRADMLGISTNEITCRLNESYTFEDVDRVFDTLQKKHLNLSKLPFSISDKTNIKITESVETIKPKTTNSFWDNGDEIDDSLLRLAGLTDWQK